MGIATWCQRARDCYVPRTALHLHDQILILRQPPMRLPGSVPPPTIPGLCLVVARHLGVHSLQPRGPHHAASTTGQERTTWYPHPLRGSKPNAQWDTKCAEVSVHSAIRTEAANRTPSVGTPSSTSSCARACRAWSFLSGPRMKVTDGDTGWAQRRSESCGTAATRRRDEKS